MTHSRTPAVPRARQDPPAFDVARARCFAVSILAVSIAEPALAEGPRQPGWILEHFGREVSILRTHRDPQDVASMGRIFLSCEGQAKRVRIELPRRHTGGAGFAPRGFLLLRPSGVADGPSVVWQYGAQDARTVFVHMATDAAYGHGIGALSRLLMTRPVGLDLLLRDLRAATLGRIDSFVLPLRFGEGDLAAINGFATACLQEDQRSGKASR